MEQPVNFVELAGLQADRTPRRVMADRRAGCPWTRQRAQVAHFRRHDGRIGRLALVLALCHQPSNQISSQGAALLALCRSPKLLPPANRVLQGLTVTVAPAWCRAMSAGSTSAVTSTLILHGSLRFLIISLRYSICASVHLTAAILVEVSKRSALIIVTYSERLR